MQYDWDKWRLRPLNVPRILELFKEFGFRSLADQVRAAGGDTAPTQRTLFDQRPDLDFKFGANAEEAGTNGTPVEEPLPAPEPLTTVGDGWNGDYRLVNTAQTFDEFCRELQKQKRFAIDLETTGLEPLRVALVGLAFSWQEGEGWYVAVRGPQGAPVLDTKATLERLRPILEDPAVAKVNQNIKYDMLVLRAHGINVAGVAGDSMVADYLLNAGERAHNKDDLARRHLHHQVIPITELIGEKSRKTPQKQMDEVDPAQVAVYAGEDADLAWRLCEVLERQLGETYIAPGLPGSGLSPPARLEISGPCAASTTNWKYR